VRLGCADFVGILSRTSGIRDISLTTNGILLPKFAAELREAGLHRVNISLDSLDPQRFAEVTRGGELAATLAGIDAAFEAGFSPIKINTLLLEGVQAELDAFVELTLHREIHVRFIEFMPLDRRVAGEDPAGDGRLVPAGTILGLCCGVTSSCARGSVRSRSGAVLARPRRARHHRLHRRRLGPLLRELQPATADL